VIDSLIARRPAILLIGDSLGFGGTLNTRMRTEQLRVKGYM